MKNNMKRRNNRDGGRVMKQESSLHVNLMKMNKRKISIDFVLFQFLPRLSHSFNFVSHSISLQPKLSGRSIMNCQRQEKKGLETGKERVRIVV